KQKQIFGVSAPKKNAVLLPDLYTDEVQGLPLSAWGGSGVFMDGIGAVDRVPPVVSDGVSFYREGGTLTVHLGGVHCGIALRGREVEGVLVLHAVLAANEEVEDRKDSDNDDQNNGQDLFQQ